MMKKTPGEEALLRRKRIFALISFAILLCVISFLTYFLIVRFSKIAKTGEEFRDFIKGYGAYGFLVAVGIQVLQVFIALIPGEFVEIGMGYAYGWFEASVLSLFGVAIGSGLIFILTKKFGVRFIEIFVSGDKINDLKFIKDEEKFNRLTFLLYFIPGTPKDLITYFIALTRMTLKDFLGITLFARIPSVVSSTVGGNFIGEKRYAEALILFVITAAVSLVGIKLYNIILKRIREKAKRRKERHKH
jgi:uncharacterized membrane protein YdjX (TVP38/TMEM64 family)